MALISMLKGLFELYKSKIANRFIYNGAQKLSIKVYELLIKEGLLEHNEKSAMQALNLVRNDTTSCIQIITNSVAIAVSAITMAGYAFLLIYAFKWIGIVSILLLLLLMVLVFIRMQAQMIAYGEKSRALSIRTNAQVTIAFGSFKEMKIDDRSSFVLDKYAEASSSYAQVQGEYMYKTGTISIILQNSIMAVIFVILAIFLLVGENLSSILAPMVVYITALAKILPLAYSVLNGINTIKFAEKSYTALKECMAEYDRIKEEEDQAEALRTKKLTLSRQISVQNLTFGYTEHRKIFDNASIDIPAGCSVAIIGPSGAGKTTFIDLLLGLLPPQSGSIRFDDYDIVSQTDAQGACKAGMGELVSYIPQTVYLNGETIRNNVAFFENDEQIDDAKIEECLKCAQIWKDVQQMPDGIHTMIGENGTAISGGQRQRIALARALYKNFELLVMDEATAALDRDTEKAVIDSIRQIKGDKTLIMVTHRMNLAEECDMICKVENGKIVRVQAENVSLQ